MHLNRIVAVLTAIAGLASAVSVPLANLDTTSTAGIIAGLGAVTAAAVTWLLGWQKHEARLAAPDADVDELPHIPPMNPAVVEPDQGDKGAP